MDNRKIGVFDSGVGGLTVLSEIYKQLPNEEIVYFGDTGRNPYGSKPKDTITFFSEQIINFLLTHDVKMILIACNTATVASLVQLQQKFIEPIMGVVDAGVNATVESTKNNRIGILATEATIKSNIYTSLIEKAMKNRKIEVFSKACPLLVNLIEEGLADTEISYITCKYYIDDLLEKGIDTIVLACTHFPLHIKDIRRIVGSNIEIVEPSCKTVENLKKVIEQSNMLRSDSCIPSHKFYVSGNVSKFKLMYDKIIGGQCEVEKVEIEKY